MSKRSTAPHDPGRPRPKQDAPPQSTPAPTPPLTPRPKLLAGLLLAFALWLGALLVLYFQTVYPMRHPSAATTRPGASALPSAPR